jgi:hypothetical protein
MSAPPATSTVPEFAPVTSEQRAPNARLFVLFLVIAVTSIVAVALAVVSYAKPMGGSDLPTYDAIASNRGYVWGFFQVAGVNLVVDVWAAAIAGWILTTARRGRLAGTIGGCLSGLGAALYGVGVGGWAVGYYLAADRATLGATKAAALVAAANHDTTHVLLVPISGAAMIAIGGIVLVIGVWRARTMPRWILALSILSGIAGFLLPPDTIVGILGEAVSSATTIAVGWYAWRLRARSHPGLAAVTPE